MNCNPSQADWPSASLIFSWNLSPLVSNLAMWPSATGCPFRAASSCARVRVQKQFIMQLDRVQHQVRRKTFFQMSVWNDKRFLTAVLAGHRCVNVVTMTLMYYAFVFCCVVVMFVVSPLCRFYFSKQPTDSPARPSACLRTSRTRFRTPTPTRSECYDKFENKDNGAKADAQGLFSREFYGTFFLERAICKGICHGPQQPLPGFKEANPLATDTDRCTTFCHCPVRDAMKRFVFAFWCNCFTGALSLQPATTSRRSSTRKTRSSSSTRPGTENIPTQNTRHINNKHTKTK